MAKPKPKSDGNKHGEVSASSFLRMASGHKWFAKDHWKRSRKESDIGVGLMHQAIATVHEETAAVLRNEAQKVRAKP